MSTGLIRVGVVPPRREFAGRHRRSAIPPSFPLVPVLRVEFEPVFGRILQCQKKPLPRRPLGWVNHLIDEKSEIYFLRQLGSKKIISHRRSRWIAPSAVAREATMEKWNAGPISYDEKSR